MGDNKRILISWSSGKDCAWMLHQLQQQTDVRLMGLLTTFNEAVDRVAMHGVRHSLVRQQAEACGLPLTAVMLPWPCSNDDYESRMSLAIDQAKAIGVTHIAFGDLFLEDIRDYRIRQLAGTGLEPLFPVWCGSEGTHDLAANMISSGLRAVVTCLDPRRLPADFPGREFDAEFLADLPASVDPCGENGEFHTLCYAGPHLNREIPIVVGESVERDGFLFADVLPVDGEEAGGKQGCG